ncbi:ABC transporter ATP-binding protein [Anaerocolumna sp. AGMB13020]|uniref:ABC transporter ATP-binding protein n=1 Tax=Anaerocolumna sp. AGMB13020 TaxID=3081750 RepID=UPI002955B8FC|nr:ABC transporter ATP-binding protein [Anaerocolumna sp. AGMB13020]WOO36955.1 ABC transporter ATP-binding protein [Anaerocolumna sp. AGMB13020]
MLELKNITKQYKHSAAGEAAVNNVSLKIYEGEFLTILGPSGSGKSTLLSIIAGLLKPSHGMVHYNSTDIVNNRKNSTDARISYLMQGQSLLANFTVEDNLYYPVYLSGKKGNYRDRAEEVLKLVGLMEVMNFYPARLSGGENRRAAIARALMLKPQILIADEPTSSLDRENAVKVMELFKAINNEGTTIVISTHDESFLSLSDSVYRMNKGILKPVIKIA